MCSDPSSVYFRMLCYIEDDLKIKVSNTQNCTLGPKQAYNQGGPKIKWCKREMPLYTVRELAI